MPKWRVFAKSGDAAGKVLFTFFTWESVLPIKVLLQTDLQEIMCSVGYFWHERLACLDVWGVGSVTVNGRWWLVPAQWVQWCVYEKIKQ